MTMGREVLTFATVTKVPFAGGHKYAVVCHVHGEAFNHYIVRVGKHVSNTSLLIADAGHEWLFQAAGKHNREFHGAVLAERSNSVGFGRK